MWGFRKLFKKREEKSQNDYKKHRSFSIPEEGSSIILFKGVSQKKISEVLNFRYQDSKKAPEAIDFLFPQEDWLKDRNYQEFKTIISPKFGDWNLVKTRFIPFDQVSILITSLSILTSNEVNYYYIDSYCDSYSWFFAKNGQVTREFDYAMGQVIVAKGQAVCKSEQNFEAGPGGFLGRHIYDDVAIEKNNSLDQINKNLENMGPFYCGVIDISPLIKSK
ncbi:MAG: hypothetical protein NXI20_05635 [bacterium]|nr:hypothetical protein [bacterium]